MSRAIVVLVALSLIGSPLFAQQIEIRGGVQGGVIGFPGVPARDRNAPPATGTSRLLGRVVAGDTGQPLRRAQVRIMSPEIRESRVATTDAEGRYEFKDLPAGRYTLTASKGSYVNIAYGQTRANEPGRPLQLGDNQTIERVDFSLPRGGVITGRVLDEFGEPIADAEVMPMRNQWMQGQQRPMPSGRSATTNDIGEFRLYGLTPGSYFVSVTLRSGMFGMDVSSDRSGYAPTYYPASPNMASAQPIAVGVGETVSGINVSLVPIRTASVSGTVVDVEGRPARGGAVMVMQRSSNMFFGAGGGSVRPDGTFVVNGLAPGEYTLRSNPPPPDGGGIVRFDMSAMAMANITVNGEDISGIVLAPPKMVTVSGRVIVPPGAASALKPGTLRVSAVPARPDPIMGGFGQATVNEDLTFAFKSVPGLMVISGMAMPSQLTLKSVRVNGTDVTDKPIDFLPGQDVSDVELELTNTPPQVTGLVTDAHGNPAKDYTVLLFSRDPERWIGTTRHVATARPDQEGRFTVRSLAPGDYYAVALEAMDAMERGNPELLEAQIAGATSFSLGEAETRTLDLRLTPAR